MDLMIVFCALSKFNKNQKLLDTNFCNFQPFQRLLDTNGQITDRQTTDRQTSKVHTHIYIYICVYVTKRKPFLKSLTTIYTSILFLKLLLISTV